MMKTTLTVAGAGLMLAAGSAAAQDIPETPPAQPPAPVETAQVPPSDAPAVEATERDFSDQEISGFASAALQIRELREDESLDQEALRAEAETIVAAEGLDPETYSAIGQAAQADPAIAQRVQLAIAAMQGESDS